MERMRLEMINKNKETKFVEKLLRKGKWFGNWTLFIVRNTIAFLFLFVSFFFIILITGAYSIIHQFGAIQGLLLIILLFTVILFLFLAFLLNKIIIKRIVKHAVVLKLLAFVAGLYLAFQFQYSLRMVSFSLVLIGIIYVILCCFSVKNLFWINRFQFANNHSIMEDKPVYQSDNLTKNQKAAFVQLESALSKATKRESFIIALVGDWGVGKTGITNSLYTEYREKYLFIQLDLLGIKKVRNIVEYINDYLKEYFYFYGIEFWGESHNIQFLEAVFNLSSPNIWQRIENIIPMNSFQDIRAQREEFAENIQKLLKRSGKEKIVIVVDDIDRTDHQKEIYPLLWEITDIPGIFSILNVSPFNDNKDKNDKIGDLDKYIQTFIFVPREIELAENSITEDIKRQFNEVTGTKYHRYKFDWWNFGRYFTTTERLKEDFLFFSNITEKSLSDPKYNCFIDFFYTDLFQLNLSFEEYVKKIIIDYYKKIPLGALIINEQFESLPLKEVVEQIFMFFYESMDPLLRLNSKSNNIVLNEEEYKWISKVIPEEYFSKEGNVYISKSNLLHKNKLFSSILRHIVYSNILYLFIDDLTESLKNYREFKGNLRTAQVKEISYFEYKIQQWKYDEERKIINLLERDLYNRMKPYGFKIDDFSIDYLFVNILYNTYLWREEEYRNQPQEKNNNE